MHLKLDIPASAEHYCNTWLLQFYLSKQGEVKMGPTQDQMVSYQSM